MYSCDKTACVNVHFRNANNVYAHCRQFICVFVFVCMNEVFGTQSHFMYMHVCVLNACVLVCMCMNTADTNTVTPATQCMCVCS